MLEKLEFRKIYLPRASQDLPLSPSVQNRAWKKLNTAKLPFVFAGRFRSYDRTVFFFTFVFRTRCRWIKRRLVSVVVRNTIRVSAGRLQNVLYTGRFRRVFVTVFSRLSRCLSTWMGGRGGVVNNMNFSKTTDAIRSVEYDGGTFKIKPYFKETQIVLPSKTTAEMMRVLDDVHFGTQK